MITTLLLAVLLVAAAALLWVGWRLASQRAVLPCPAEFAWLVELENPIAQATRSARIVAHLAPKPGDRVADIGCGPGRVTLPLARAVGAAGEVIALDVQQAMLAKVAEKAKVEGLANLRLVPADARTTDLGALDGAVLVMALGEIPDGAGVMRAIAAALRPGGRLLIAESVFDPHYVRRARVRALANAAGLIERSLDGNFAGYSLVFARPAR